VATHASRAALLDLRRRLISTFLEAREFAPSPFWGQANVHPVPSVGAYAEVIRSERPLIST